MQVLPDSGGENYPSKVFHVEHPILWEKKMQVLPDSGGENYLSKVFHVEHPILWEKKCRFCLILGVKITPQKCSTWNTPYYGRKNAGFA